METALTIVWDAGIAPGDRIAVIGAGLVGLLVARLAALIPGTTVTVADINPDRADTAARLGLTFTEPDKVAIDQDIAINTTASSAGLVTALAVAGVEATVVEASWHGDAMVSLPLGAAFHSRRLRLVSSQVGMIPAGRRSRWTHRRRLEAALSLLTDPALDCLISGESAFVRAPADYPAVLADPATLAHVFCY
jgi:threonine dehydrogenase-like Zn-dependent dehydrogenase